MPTQRVITLSFDSKGDALLIHQIRNLGEDLWREIELTELGDVGGLAAVDAAEDRLVVRIKHARKVGRARKLVAEILQQHFLDGRATTTYS